MLLLTWKIWLQVSGELDWNQTVLAVPGTKNSTRVTQIGDNQVITLCMRRIIGEQNT